ncbi:MAG: hypothetical protein WDO56_28365 [Gammaproteobacteria bacterium]
MYDLYKPLRNHLRHVSLLQSLGAVRAYQQYLQFGQAFPRDIEVPTVFFQKTRAEKGIYEWELELLAKELILNAPDQANDDFRRWNAISSAVNKLKDLENEVAGRYDKLFSENILLEVYRIAHRQFPWQAANDSVRLTRYFKLFSTDKLHGMLEKHLGLDARTLYTIGLLFSGAFLEHFGVDWPLKTTLAGITEAQFANFAARFATDLPSLRERIGRAQSYDQDYAYAFNPLKVSPLIHVVNQGKPALIAPVPSYLFRRFTEGVYYDLINVPGFAGAFGAAFQAYAGEVITAADPKGALTLLREETYHVGKDQKHAVDWIVTDGSGALFVECKTKRLPFAAKVALASKEVLEEELGKLAKAVVQVYKTLADANAGLYPHWKPSKLPVFPLVVTLEDWYAFGDEFISGIDGFVRAGLVDESLDPKIMETLPYTICSIDDFECVIQVVVGVGIKPVMDSKTQGEAKLWLLRDSTKTKFPAEYKAIKRNLFQADFERIRPQTAGGEKKAP